MWRYDSSVANATVETAATETSPIAAIAVDPTDADLIVATDNGRILHTASDGSTISILASICTGADILSLAYDAKNIYALVALGSGSAIYAVKRF